MKYRLFALVLVFTLLLAMPAQASDALENTKKSVARISVTAYNEELEKTISWLGTGFAVGLRGQNAEYFVTNRHVIEDTYYPVSTDEGHREYLFKVKTIHVIFDNSERGEPANVTIISDRCDLAVIRLDSPSEKRVNCILRTFDNLASETVWAIGFPGVSDDIINSKATDNTRSSISDMSVTSGVVSRVSTHETTSEGQIIQHDAVISAGNSGGPLVDKDGYVLGVNSSIAVAVTNMSYAVSANEVTNLLDGARVPYTTADTYIRQRTLKIVFIAAAAMIVLVAAAVLIVRKPRSFTAHTAPNRTLLGVAGELAGRRYPVNAKTVVGRDVQKCTIVYPPKTPNVSGIHFSLLFDGATVTITDENSSYGTWVDNVRLAPGSPTVLHRGQTIYVGSQKQAMRLES